MRTIIPTVNKLAFVLLGLSAGTVWAQTAHDSCGYPYGSAPALTSIPFSESGVLIAFSPGPIASDGRVIAWYSDETALTLGVRQVSVKTSAGTTTTSYSTVFTPYNSTTMAAINPRVGATALAGAQAGTDTATLSASYGFLDHGRPIFPALYITDITDNPASTQGDWQQSGISPVAPTAVYGAWKGAVRTVDQTRTPWDVKVTPDANPAKNNWLGIPDTPPTGFVRTEGYTAEIVWSAASLGLIPGRTYRLQFMVHDGDQNKAGGDSGEACVQIQVPQGFILQ